MVSAPGGKHLVKYAKNFARPMGIAVDEETGRMAIATKNHVDVFSSDNKLSFSIPDNEKKYDRLYLPQTKYYTGYLDTHEISWGTEGLWVVNTMFSCLSQMSDTYSFVPGWKPDFIEEISPDDKCHLNGVCVVNGKPKYVSCFNGKNTRFSWKGGFANEGLIIDVESNEPLVTGLSMPHSPTLVGDHLYFLQSGTGEVNRFNISSGELETISQTDTFLRGLVITDKYLFVGASLVRKESSMYQHLSFDKEKSYCGIIVLDRNTGKRVSGMTYNDRIKEIFSLKILKGSQSPAIFTEKDILHDKGVTAGENLNFWIKTGRNAYNEGKT